MFRKLLSNLPFNPSLVEQVAFYAKRLHREAYIRAIGGVFIVLALLIQLFASVSPPQANAQVNGNDLIPGGFNSQGSAIVHCNNNDYGYRDILANYNISCANVASGSVVAIKSTDYYGQLYSMGRIAYNKAGEYPVTIAGTTYYMRYLSSWDHGYASTYYAVQGTSNSGARFFLLFDCGNLVIVGKPAPPPPPKDYCPNIPGTQSSTTQCDVCPNIPGTQLSGNCKPCTKSTSPSDIDNCLSRKKTARNITQSISDANNTTAKPGDIIEYTLTVSNSAVVTRGQFVVQENIEDILEYATVTDFHGGVMKNDKVVKWPAHDIKAGGTLSQKLTIKVKNPLPDTPRSTSNPGSYDLMMTNVYGNAVNIKLPNSPVKVTETVTQSLPNTGPGTSLLIGFGITTIIGYFIARTRLMAKEMDIAKREAVSVGGQ